MKQLGDWLERQAELEDRNPSLQSAFLHDRFFVYAWHRLRFFLARTTVGWVLHVAGVFLLFGSFSRRAFGVITVAHFVMAAVGSFWWGGLEPMRAHVRHLYRTGRPQMIPREVGRWLGLSLGLAATIVLGAGLWLGVRFGLGYPLGLVDTYLLCLALRLAVELPYRCYHSGLFAIRRIYRPLPAMLMVDLLGFLALIALWPVLGRWSFPVATLLSGILVVVVGLHYTGRAYRQLGIQPFTHLGSRWARRFNLETITELVTAGAANAVMSLEILVVPVIMAIGAQRGFEAPFFVLFFTISPAIRAGYEWGQLFYFDLKRLDAAPFGNLSSWLGRGVARLGWVVGPFFWVLACLAAVAVAGKPLWGYWLPLLPFFHSRSLLAAFQVRNFARGAYARLIGSGVLLLIGYMASSLWLPPIYTLFGLAAVNYCIVYLLSHQLAVSWRQGRRPEPLPPAVWCREVDRLGTAVQISAVRFCPNDGENPWRRHREEAQRKARRLAREIAWKLGTAGAVTVMYPGRILWFDTTATRTSSLLHWVITRGAGLLELAGQTGPQQAGTSALREARAHGFLGNDVRRDHLGLEAASPARARAAFLKLFPEGHVWAPGGPVGGLADLSPKQTRELVGDAVVFARDFYPNVRNSGSEVTALCDGHKLQLVFVTGRGGDLALRARWRSLVRNLNLNGATGLAEGLNAPRRDAT
ncbi:MAG TPA: hypothetical protein VG347_23085 [Verrucomicrobiae bacterium]|nr:hypothetical protein [Verrucomicrobiae bacterium]